MIEYEKGLRVIDNSRLFFVDSGVHSGARGGTLDSGLQEAVSMGREGKQGAGGGKEKRPGGAREMPGGLLPVYGGSLEFM